MTGRRHTSRLMGICWLLAGTATASFGQQPDAVTELQHMMEKYHAVGLAVAVVKDGQPVYVKAMGQKDLESGELLEDKHLFRIASISKSFTATAIMQLVEAGKLSLDDDVGDLVGFKVRHPAFPETVITLRMLLSHTSGINDRQGYFTLDVIDPSKNPDWEKCYSDYQPGTGYRYCNLNYNMAGTIVERISGKRFDQYIKQQILDPLRVYGGYGVDSLDKSLFATLYTYDTVSQKITPSPMAYAPRSEEIANYVMGYSTPVFSPTGGMKISAAGLATCMSMHMHDGTWNGVTILSPESARQMRLPVAEKEGYGLALQTTDKLIPGEMLVGHTGVAYGLYSAMFFQPDKKFGIVIISNGCSPGYTGGFNSLIRDVANSLYSRYINVR